MAPLAPEMPVVPVAPVAPVAPLAPPALLVPGNAGRSPMSEGPPAQRRRLINGDEVMAGDEPDNEPAEEAEVPAPNPAVAYEAYLIDRVQTNELRDYTADRLRGVLRTINDYFPQERRLLTTGTRRAMLVRIRTFVRDRGWVPRDFVPDDPGALPPERQLRGLGL